MGKVVKAVAVIAVAVAIAYFAPQLTPAFLTAAIGKAAAVAVVATLLSTAATAALQAISSAPADAPSGARRGTMQRDGFQWVEVPPTEPEPMTMAPIEPRSWWWAFFLPGQRYSVIRIAGDCLKGMIDDRARWALVSRYDPIRAGDLFAFDLDDLFGTYAPDVRFRWFWRIFAVGMVKRYLGQETAWGRIIFDCSNPPTICETGRNRVRYAYRVLSVHPSWLAAMRARVSAARKDTRK